MSWRDTPEAAHMIKVLNELMAEGLIIMTSNDNIMLTAEGKRREDEVWARFGTTTEEVASKANVSAPMPRFVEGWHRVKPLER
jgi:Mn-dependent DtxR family transcriptional regulator